MITQDIWVLICGALVFFMQAGFTCYEAGFVQSKNVISVSIENLLTFMITVVMYLFVGLPLMYGKNIMNLSGGDYCYLFLQIMFAAVAVTIFAGAMSERSKLSALLIASVVVAGLIYPVYGRWVWGSLANASGAWLADMGFMDFAGASVVHSTAGFVTLAGLIIVGRRRETRSGKSNIPLATLGVFILWFGWLGFNGGNTPITEDFMGLVFVNTTIAASFGMIGALVVNLILRRKGRYLISIFNGVLSGLVAITAMSGYCRPLGAVAVGIIAGVMADCSTMLLDKWHIDDVVNAVPTHLVGGIAGTLLLPFVIEKQYLACGTRSAQFGAQLLGISVNAAWTLGLSLLLFFIIKKTIGIRVSGSEEKKGLNIVEFNDLYSWETYMEISSYESEINDKNTLLNKQAKLLVATETREREKLARELHDGLGQSLATLKLILKMQKGTVPDEALELTETSIAEMRNVLYDLRPACLDDGLYEAIKFMAKNLSDIDGFTCTVENKDAWPEPDDAVSLNIYRLIQEALTNVVKHSGAGKAVVRCDKNDDGSCDIAVTDDGVGFDKDDTGSSGIGLLSMRDRARMIGGDIDIITEKGRGTEIIIHVPAKNE